MELGGLVKAPLKLLVIFFAIIYILSPVDVLPEALLGPIGFIDDLMALLAKWGMVQGKGIRESLGSGVDTMSFGMLRRKGGEKK